MICSDNVEYNIVLQKTLVSFFTIIHLTNISHQVDESVPLSKKIFRSEMVTSLNSQMKSSEFSKLLHINHRPKTLAWRSKRLNSR